MARLVRLVLIFALLAGVLSMGAFAQDARPYRIVVVTHGQASDPTGSANRIPAALTADATIDAIFTLGPTGAAPALQVLEDLGLVGQIFIATFDLSPDVLAAIRDGNMLFAIDQQQYILDLDLDDSHAHVIESTILSPFADFDVNLSDVPGFTNVVEDFSFTPSAQTEIQPPITATPIGNSVNMRSFNGTEFSVAGTTGSQDTVEVLGEVKDNNGVSWYQVKKSDGTIGWIKGDLLSGTELERVPEISKFLADQLNAVVDSNGKSAINTYANLEFIAASLNGLYELGLPKEVGDNLSIKGLRENAILLELTQQVGSKEPGSAIYISLESGQALFLDPDQLLGENEQAGSYGAGRLGDNILEVLQNGELEGYLNVGHVNDVLIQNPNTPISEFFTDLRDINITFLEGIGLKLKADSQGSVLEIVGLNNLVLGFIDQTIPVDYNNPLAQVRLSGDSPEGLTEEMLLGLFRGELSWDQVMTEANIYLYDFATLNEEQLSGLAARTELMREFGTYTYPDKDGSHTLYRFLPTEVIIDSQTGFPEISVKFAYRNTNGIAYVTFSTPALIKTETFQLLNTRPARSFPLYRELDINLLMLKDQNSRFASGCRNLVEGSELDPATCVAILNDKSRSTLTFSEFRRLLENNPANGELIFDSGVFPYQVNDSLG